MWNGVWELSMRMWDVEGIMINVWDAVHGLWTISKKVWYVE